MDKCGAVYSGSSMLGTFCPGDEVECVPVEESLLRNGDVIVFLNPERTRKIVHRIIRINDLGLFTMGDNNSTPDATPVKFEFVCGLVIGLRRGTAYYHVSRGWRGMFSFYRRRGVRLIHALKMRCFRLLGVSAPDGQREDFQLSNHLLMLLGRIFRDECPEERWQQLSRRERQRLCVEAFKHGLTPWFYESLYSQLPELEQQRFGRIHQRLTAKTVREEYELLKFYRALEMHQIRFAPIKGTDFAFRTYPNPVLRLHGDWDILFHPDDCGRILPFLKSEHWTCGCEIPRDCCFPLHRKGNNALAPHDTLPNFPAVSPLELWTYIHPVPGWRYRYELSPELHFLTLRQQAGNGAWRQVEWYKLLLDAGFLLRYQQPDVKRVCDLAERWHLPSPGILIASWPEFFPAQWVESWSKAPAKPTVLPDVLDLRTPDFLPLSSGGVTPLGD